MPSGRSWSWRSSPLSWRRRSPSRRTRLSPRRPPFSTPLLPQGLLPLLRHARPLEGPARELPLTRQGRQRPQPPPARVRSGRYGVGQHRQRRDRRLGVARPLLGRRRHLGRPARQGEHPEHLDRHPHADVQPHRPARPPARLVRACGDAAGRRAAPTGSTRRSATRSATARAPTRRPATTSRSRPTTLYGRTIAAARRPAGRHGLGERSTAAAAGDEIWLDRSWDGGASWPDGSSLGRTQRPERRGSTRTAMFATRDPRGLLYGGAVRACGREVDGTRTAAARRGPGRPPTRPRAAADALMCVVPPGHRAGGRRSWWNSAVALTALIDCAAAHRDARLRLGRRPAPSTVNKGAFAGRGAQLGPDRGRLHQPRRSTTRAWWGMAWVDGVRPAPATALPNEAVTIANYVHRYWDTGTCGGGVWWDRERTYKNAVTERAVPAADRGAAQPDRRRHGVAARGRRPAGTGSWPAG